jgi:hypothetical protein
MGAGMMVRGDSRTAWLFRTCALLALCSVPLASSSCTEDTGNPIQTPGTGGTGGSSGAAGVGATSNDSSGGSASASPDAAEECPNPELDPEVCFSCHDILNWDPCALFDFPCGARQGDGGGPAPGSSAEKLRNLRTCLCTTPSCSPLCDGFCFDGEGPLQCLACPACNAEFDACNAHNE